MVRSGDRIVLSKLCAELHLLPNLLMDRHAESENGRVFHLRPFGTFIGRYLEENMEKHIRCVALFAGGIPQIVQLMSEGSEI